MKFRRRIVIQSGCYNSEPRGNFRTILRHKLPIIHPELPIPTSDLNSSVQPEFPNPKFYTEISENEFSYIICKHRYKILRNFFSKSLSKIRILCTPPYGDPPVMRIPVFFRESARLPCSGQSTSVPQSSLKRRLSS